MSTAMIQTAEVVANRPLCREHLRLTLCVPTFGAARPGQFVHLSPHTGGPTGYRAHDWEAATQPPGVECGTPRPMLRRAFSIAAMRRRAEACEIDVIYRVVGAGTNWMATLGRGDRASVLGPLGNTFPIIADKPLAWLVAGGVGLPPMLWLAEALSAAGKDVVAFYGAQTRSLVALELTDTPPSPDARRAADSSIEFAASDTRVVLATDDGSLGFRGHIGQALAAYHAANPTPPVDVVVYTCGPDRMMHFVADHCAAHSIRCYACLEQAMACGTGACQSCVVPVRDASDPAGWRYALCCTDGPVFDAALVEWDFNGDPNYRSRVS